MDQVISSRGRQLIELCIQSGLRILNGRIFGDSFGQYTSHQPLGSSVIDYFIVSESLLRQIPVFKVQPFKADLSDHCQITSLLRVNCFIPLFESNLKSFPEKYVWNDDSPVKFQNALVSEKVKKYINLFLDEKNVKNDFINESVEKFNNILYEAADLSLKKKKTSSGKKSAYVRGSKKNCLNGIINH